LKTVEADRNKLEASDRKNGNALAAKIRELNGVQAENQRLQDNVNSLQRLQDHVNSLQNEKVRQLRVTVHCTGFPIESNSII
jgi:hypothetical protein